MIYNSDVMSQTEEQMLKLNKKTYKDLARDDKKTYNGAFMKSVPKIMQPLFYEVRWHQLAAWTLFISNFFLAYSRLLCKEDHTFLIMTTYISALLLWTFTALEEIVCSDCVLKLCKLKGKDL